MRFGRGWITGWSRLTLWSKEPWRTRRDFVDGFGTGVLEHDNGENPSDHIYMKKEGCIIKGSDTVHLMPSASFLRSGRFRPEIPVFWQKTKS